ncbi:MAG: SDR family oxidoreductase [Halioglobus sp.]|nr:SDR family oxidoreductase [Halioglobus sp.]
MDQTSGRLLITGATGGMGSACSLLAAERGHSLLLTDLDADKLRELQADCIERGVACDTWVTDVTDFASIDGLAECAGSLRIDGAIHTIGLSPQMADWRTIIEVDLVGNLTLVEAVRPAMNPGACSVCIASMSGHMVPANEQIDAVLADPLAADFGARLTALAADEASLEHSGLAYAYAKKALKNYVASHAFRWGAEDKRIVSISPGLIDTEQGQLESNAMDNFDEMQSLIALRRLGAAEDIANLCLYLVSEQASYITGCDILVDGGFIARMNEQQAAPAGNG